LAVDPLDVMEGETDKSHFIWQRREERRGCSVKVWQHRLSVKYTAQYVQSIFYKHIISYQP
jgi:hypothetical protein